MIVFQSYINKSFKVVNWTVTIGACLVFFSFAKTPHVQDWIKGIRSLFCVYAAVFRGVFCFTKMNK